MKTLLAMIISFSAVSAQADTWNCKGTTGEFKEISFTADSLKGLTQFSAVALNLEDIEARMVNEFTLSIAQAIDIKAQESKDYTFILNQSESKILVYAQYCGAENSYLEDTLTCTVK